MPETEAWVEKHRPESFEGVQGNNKAIREITKWAEEWSPGDQPILLVGPPGTGKTTTAYILADMLDVPLNEINASSARKGEDIRKIAKSMQSSPADADMQLVLLDEVDNWHHSVDKKPLYDALKDPRNPAVLTANDKYDTPNSIKSASKTFTYSLQKRSRKAKLRDIAEREDVDLDDHDLGKLAERADLRSAINDLQTWSETGKPPGGDERELEMSDFDAAESLLKKGGTWQKALSPQTGNKGLRPEWAMMWADENMRDRFRGLEAGVAYDALSRADRRLRQGYDTQARGLPYASALLSLLPGLRLSEPYMGYINVDFPSWVQSKESKYDDGSPEAELFNVLKDDRGFTFAGSFSEFKHEILPLLRDLPEAVRYRLALNHGVDEDSLEPLGIDEDEFEDWVQDKEPETGEWSPETNSAADW